MKKFLSFLLSFALIFSVVSAAGASITAAAPNTFIFSIDNAQIAEGATTVSIPVTLQNPGATGMSMRIDFDEPLTFVNATFSGIVTPWSVADPAPGVLFKSFNFGTSAVAHSGVVMTLNFSVPATHALTAAPTVTISAGVTDFNMNGATPMAFVGDSATVTRAAAPTPTVILTPAAVTVNNANLSVESAVSGTATGAITIGTVTPAFPAGVTAVVQGTNIVVTGERPAHDAAADITGTHTVEVQREGVTQPLSVTLNLTREDAPPPPPPGRLYFTVGDVQIAHDATTVTVPVSLANPGATSLNIVVTYDAANLTFVGADFTGLDTPIIHLGPAAGTRVMSWSLGTSPVTHSGNVMNLQFSVLATNPLTPPATVAIEMGNPLANMNDVLPITVIGDTGNITRAGATFVPVTEITGVPTTATVGTPLTLTGVVAPANATNSAPIVWTVVGTGATISGNTLTATAAGTVTVRATIANGLTATTDFTQDFAITVSAAAVTFVPVTSITGVPTTTVAGTPLALTGTVNPANATNRAPIVWTVVNAGTTGATITGNMLNTNAAGTVTVRATIVNGLTATSNFTQDFDIVVSAATHGGGGGTGTNGGGGTGQQQQPSQRPPATPSTPPVVETETDNDNDNDNDLPEPPQGEELFRGKFVIGYPNGNFMPGNNITRAEAAVIMVRTLLPAGASSANIAGRFTDVDSGEWYFGYLAQAYANNLIIGFPDGSFRPNQTITREEFATLLARTTTISPGTSLPFSDAANISGWAVNYVNTVLLRNWMHGDAAGTFRPHSFITRAEATAAVSRVLERGDTTPQSFANVANVLLFPDVSQTAWYFTYVVDASNSHWFVFVGQTPMWTRVVN